MRKLVVGSWIQPAAMAKLDKVVVREGTTPFVDAMHQVAGGLLSVSMPG